MDRTIEEGEYYPRYTGPPPDAAELRAARFWLKAKTEAGFYVRHVLAARSRCGLVTDRAGVPYAFKVLLYKPNAGAKLGGIGRTSEEALVAAYRFARGYGGVSRP